MRPYQYVERVTEGGFGEVWRVLDATGMPRALKRVLDTSPSSINALRDEIAKLVQLSSVPGVIKIVDYDLECEHPFFVMELAQCSLRDLINGPMKPELAARFTLDVIHVVRETHRRGVLHRDVKPDNILLANGAVKLADFGLGKGAGSILMTVGGAGTPGYMAPEQYNPGGLSVLADVYGIGATLYHLLTGERPPEGIANLDPRGRVPSCPAGIAGIVRLMTALDPRYRMPLAHAESALKAVVAHQRRFVPEQTTPLSRGNGTVGLFAAASLVAIGAVLTHKIALAG